MPDIQIKKGLAAALSATNPIVASGEPVFETDTLKLKIGDGVTAYNSLGLVSPIRSYTTTSTFPASGIANTYYIASDSSKIYQWTGSQYAEIGPSLGGLNNSQAAINLFLWSNFR
jgi:hypothetical protein